MMKVVSIDNKRKEVEFWGFILVIFCIVDFYLLL